MPSNITLVIGGEETTLPWLEFVKTLDATEISQTTYSILDLGFALQCATLVLMMQGGFMMIEAGSISNRLKLRSIVLKNFGDNILAGTIYMAIGYGISYGDGGSFIGGSGFALQGFPMCTENDNGTTICDSKQYALLIYRLTFAISTGTILSGAVAERMRLPLYYISSCFVSCWMYPVVCRWIWYKSGWASIHNSHENRLFGTGVLDYAGSGVVHMTGALPALILLPLLGPRKHRFRGDSKEERLPGQNNYYTTIGAMILWMCWYGFVCGSTASSAHDLGSYQGSVVAKIAVNTTVAAAAASLVTVLLGLYYEKKTDCSNANNGIIAGLVGITGSCATVDTEFAVVIGFVSAFVYFSASKCMIKVKLDDVVDAVPIHLCCGLWGLIAPAIFSRREYVELAFNHYTNSSEVPCGILYSCDGLGSKLLAANLTYALALVAWVGTMSCLLFIPLHFLKLLRKEMPEEEEIEVNTESYSEELPDLVLPTIAEEDNIITNQNAEESDQESTTTDERSDTDQVPTYSTSEISQVQSVYPDVIDLQRVQPELHVIPPSPGNSDQLRSDDESTESDDNIGSDEAVTPNSSHSVS